jgi:ATP-dependent RNA helicase DeaD
MLSMGFKSQLDAILSTTTIEKKTWLFSATMGKEVQQIVKNYMKNNPKQVVVKSYGLTNENISHQFYQCTNAQKTHSMIQFINSQGGNRGIIFCNTKSNADTLSKQLIAKNISADALQGDLTQKERDKVMRAFKNESIQILVSTDVSARGIDVKDLGFVMHQQLPIQSEYYTHRSGRTARAGKKGVSLAFIAEKEMPSLQNIERKLGIKFSKTTV